LENDTTHGQTGSTIHRSRPPADQSGSLSAWQATVKSPDTCDILVPSSRVCRACRRGRYKETTRKLVPWNASLLRRVTHIKFESFDVETEVVNGGMIQRDEYRVQRKTGNRRSTVRRRPLLVVPRFRAHQLTLTPRRFLESQLKVTVTIITTAWQVGYVSIVNTQAYRPLSAPYHPITNFNPNRKSFEAKF